jgi:hypothetical protein
MSEPFDPYSEWLGIGPEEQPPDHYRLLDIDRFESDCEVISLAARKRAAHIETFLDGDRTGWAEQTSMRSLRHATVCSIPRPNVSTTTLYRKTWTTESRRWSSFSPVSSPDGSRPSQVYRSPHRRLPAHPLMENAG